MSRAIAIDGPAASGKSTVAKILAKELNLVMVNSGAMYRAVAYKLIQNGVDITDESAVAASVADLNLECGVDSSGHFSTVGYDGTTLDNELRTTDINHAVSLVAKVPELRAYLLEKQRAYLEHSDVVMEGRDIGTVIFPNTAYKFFFEASAEVRQARREAEGITDSVVERDRQDSSRKSAPLKAASDAIKVDTGAHDIQGVASYILGQLKELGWEA